MFFQWSGGAANPPVFVGFGNFIRLFAGDLRFRNALKVTFYIAGVGVIIQTILGTAIALLLNKSFFGRSVIRAILLLPMMATWVATALVWRWMMHPTSGILNYFLELIGLPRLMWLSSPSTVIPSLILIDTWQWTPLIIIIVLAGLQSLPKEPYESAQIDGANSWQTFWHITLPLIRPVILTAMVLRCIDAIKTFDIIMSASQGGPGFASENLNVYTYSTALYYFRIGYASTLIIVFFALVLLSSFLLSKLKGEVYVE